MIVLLLAIYPGIDCEKSSQSDYSICNSMILLITIIIVLAYQFPKQSTKGHMRLALCIEIINNTRGGIEVKNWERS
jgi:hypothetical protein